MILDGAKERQADFVFTANVVGEYRFCFNNEMSTFAEKMVDFEIAVRCLGLFIIESEASHTFPQPLSFVLPPVRSAASPQDKISIKSNFALTLLLLG